MRPRPNLLIGIYLIFTVSGFTGLLYESLWAHYLKLLLGHASYAQILTLVIFMGGLGAGSFLGGRYVRLFGQPFLLYILVEILIGLGGLSYHPLYRGVSGWIFSQAAVLPSPLFLGLKLLLAVMITLPWAILLGVTFPVLAAGVMELSGDQGRRSLPGLYCFNSLGGALGILTCSFLLIPRLGTPGALSLAGSLNMILGLVFYFLLRNTEEQESVPVNSLTVAEIQIPALLSRRLSLFLTAVAFFTGFSSFLYEIVWIRLLSLMIGSSTHSFDLMVSAFIGGLALGSLMVRNWMRQQQHPLRLLALIQMAMGLCAAFSLLFYEQIFHAMNHSHLVLRSSEQAYLLYSVFKYLLCILLMFPASFFAGMTLPLMTWTLFQHRQLESDVGRIYGWNTLGSIAGAALGGLWLMPLLQLKGTLLLAVGVDLLLGWLLWVVSIRGGLALVAVPLASLLATIPVWRLELNNLMLSAGVFREGVNLGLVQGLKSLQIRHGRTATVSFADHQGMMVIKTNGKSDASISLRPELSRSHDETTQAALAVYPLQLMRQPYQAAVIGFGSGMTAHYLLGDPWLKKLDVIEIEPEMYHLARGFFPWNQRAYQDSRMKIHFEDARAFFYTQQQQYDVLVSEPSNPWVSGVSSLFTQEFYRDTRRFIKPGGILVQWMHAYEFDDRLLMTILKALHKVYPHFAIYGLPTQPLDQLEVMDFLIIASDRPLQFPPALRAPQALEKDLARLRISARNFSSFNRIVSEQTLLPLLQFYQANSDFFPLVDNEAEKYMFTKKQLALFQFLLHTPSHYQSLFEPDFPALLRARQAQSSADYQVLLSHLSYGLSAPPGLRDAQAVVRTFRLLSRRFSTLMTLDIPIFQRYRQFLAADPGLLIPLLEFELLHWQQQPQPLLLEHIFATAQKIPVQQLSVDLARGLARALIQTRQLPAYRQFLQEKILPHPQISVLEKELLGSYLPVSATAASP